MTSFDSRAMSFNASTNAYPASNPELGRLSQASSSFRSSADVNGRPFAPLPQPEAQIYTAVYSNVGVYEMEINGVAVMRRRSDSWLNATQILKVAGVDKGRRTKILEKEILTGEHEKIQGGYGRYQGTWISYSRGREFCRAYGVEELLRPLLEYDLDNDGMVASGKNHTPTKEQAMAANRKRFYNAGPDSRPSGQGGTFFSSHSPHVHQALAAVNKFTRYENQAPARPNSSNRPPSALNRRVSQQEPNSQQGNHSFVTESAIDSTLEPLGGPARKKMRPSFVGASSQDSFAREEETPTEPNDSFSAPQGPVEQDAGFAAMSPLPESRMQEERKAALLELFVEPSQVDYSHSAALIKLHGAELDVPLDGTANTALHWAATLAKVDLVRALLERGANMFRGNAAGLTPLMTAVCSNNNWNLDTFHVLLDLLGPLIELRDAQGRTVLHHIAVSSGVQNRALSSKYYLDSLLEFTVRQGGLSQEPASFAANYFHSPVRPINLVRFMSEMVNVQDKGGKTALMLAARIGTRSIVEQLDEVGADFYLADHSGLKPVDYGILPKSQALPQIQASQSSGGSSGGPSAAAVAGKPLNPIEQMEREMLATTKAILSQTQEHYADELSKKQSRVDALNASLQAVAQEHKDALKRHETLRQQGEKVQALQHRQRTLRGFIDLKHTQISAGAFAADATRPELPVEPAELAGIDADDVGDMLELEASVTRYLESLPTSAQLKARERALKKHSALLQQRESSLRSHSMEKEAQYRQAIALTMHIPEQHVESHLGHLVQAIESEPLRGDDSDAARIRDFLRKVETVES